MRRSLTLTPTTCPTHMEEVCRYTDSATINIHSSSRSTLLALALALALADWSTVYRWVKGCLHVSHVGIECSRMSTYILTVTRPPNTPKPIHLAAQTRQRTCVQLILHVRDFPLRTERPTFHDTLDSFYTQACCFRLF